MLSWRRRKEPGGISSCRAVSDEDDRAEMSYEKSDGLLQLRSAELHGMRKNTKQKKNKATSQPRIHFSSRITVQPIVIAHCSKISTSK